MIGRIFGLVIIYFLVYIFTKRLLLLTTRYTKRKHKITGYIPHGHSHIMTDDGEFSSYHFGSFLAKVLVWIPFINLIVLACSIIAYLFAIGSYTIKRIEISQIEGNITIKLFGMKIEPYKFLKFFNFKP